MARIERWAAALLAAGLPAVALAVEAGGRDPDAVSGAPFAWLWIVAAAIVVVALFAMFFRRDRTGPTPPARHP